MRAQDIFIIGTAILLLALVVSCGQRQRGTHEITPSPVAAVSAPTKALVSSEADLPTLTLEHKGKTFEGYRFEGCWQGAGGSGIQCVEGTPIDAVDNYIEVEPGDIITVRISPDSRPTRLLASFYTEPGDLSVGSLVRLSPVEGELVIDHTPGIYNVRVNAQWFEGGARPDHKVSYVFGLSIPGEAELRSGCGSTDMGGIMGIVLESLEDPDRTAFEAVNKKGCRLNKRVVQVRLVLEGDGGHEYTETFQIEPPSLTVSFPLSEHVPSVKSGGPLPHGEYSRSIIAVTVDGEEVAFDLKGVGGVVKLTDELPQTDGPVAFPQHDKGKQTYSTALPAHIEGRLQFHRGCLYIRNGEIPVWPSGFSTKTEEDRVQVLDESGNVVGVEDQEIVLAGHEVRADDPAGREISRTMPLACPPGNFWIVGDEIGDLKEMAGRTVVPIQGSSLIFARQVPGLWSDRTSVSTEGKLIHDGDCLRIDDDERHMVFWPPLFTPHMEDGVIQVRDGEGRVVAQVGDSLNLTGLGTNLIRPHYADRCPGPYWLVGRIAEE